MAPRLFYACFAHDQPRGGIKVAYRHVDLLVRAGFDAWVFHPRERFRVSWFQNDTPVTGPSGFQRMFDPDHDVLVLPEDLVIQDAAEELLRIPGRKVIFNQNVYYGFAPLGAKVPRRYPYLRHGVCAVFTVSEHNAALLRLAYPELPVLRIRLGVDPDRFTFRRPVDKRAQIGIVTKAPLQTWTVRHLLESRARQGIGPLRGFRWRVLEGLTERAIARTLADSLLVIALGIEEGFGLLPLEAMLSGCVLAAAAGGPPDEYLPADYRFAPGDLAGVVEWIEDVATRWRARPRSLDAMTRSALARAREYTLEGERESLLAAWSAALAPRLSARTRART